MPYVSTSTAEVYYESHGEGPALLFAHGMGGHHAIWWQQIPHFRQNYQVLAIDLPGFGLSKTTNGGYDAADYPEVILAILDDAGVDKAVLVGQSLGCAAALRVGVDHPERTAGVVLCHSLGGIKDEEILKRTQADRAEQVKLAVIDRLMTKRFQAEEPERIFLFEQMTTFIASKPQEIKNEPSMTLAEIKNAINGGLRLTYLQGGLDEGTSHPTYDRLRELLPEADYEYVAEAPHSFYWEEPELFNATLDNILSRILQPA